MISVDLQQLSINHLLCESVYCFTLITMSFIKYENDNLPMSNLPYGFTRRLINLTSMAEGNKISVACPNIVARDRRHKSLKKVFIIDNRHVYNIAINEGGELINLNYFKRLIDGPLTIDPSWQSVLLLDDIIVKNEYLDINDTLILYLTSNESYDQLIPLISGTYSRLVLYGDFTWAEVERLLHSKVKQVRIMGKVIVEPEDYDNVIKFVLRFPRGFDSKFSFRIKDCFPLELMKRINKACTTHETHSLVPRRKFVHFIKKDSVQSYYLHWFFSLLIYAGWMSAFGNYIDAVYMEDPSNFLFHRSLFLCIGYFFVLLFLVGVANLVEKWPRDVRVYVKVNYPWMIQNNDH